MLADRRDSFIVVISWLGLVLVALTELLSFFEAVTRSSVILSWLALTTAAYLWRTKSAVRSRSAVRSESEVRSQSTVRSAFSEYRLHAWPSLAIILITLVLAILAAPNAPDALSYHLPRVDRWIQDRTLEFYPTHNSRQLWIGPGHEYFLLHLELITGSRRFVNLVQWAALIGCPVVVSVIARELGAASRGQLFAALFALTLPMAIVQASGAQVDLFSSFWLATTLALMLRVKRLGVSDTTLATAGALGSATGLAFLSKGTNALFVLPFAIWTIASLFPPRALRLDQSLRLVLSTAFCALCVIAPHSWRNAKLFGSPLGPRGGDSLTNEVFTPGTLASNTMRNAAIHANSRWSAWNTLLYNGIRKAHDGLGLNVDDPRTTWRHDFSVPRKREDEGISGNPFHLILVAGAFAIAARRKYRAPALYLACVIGGALLFSLVLKWQPWHGRLHLPLFVVAAGGVAAVLDKSLSRRMLGAVATLLLITATPALLRNSLRPLVSAHPVFAAPYDRRLFADASHVYESYVGAADLMAAQRCARIGLIQSGTELEYPFWKLIRDRVSAPIEIRHVAVRNDSRKAINDRERSFKPCAIVAIFEKKPSGVFAIPTGFRQAWKSGGITVFLPTGA